MNLVEIKKIVGQIKANLFNNSNSYSIGMLKSHFRGSGLMFKEHQVYNYGDEIRFIDWKMLAKTTHPYIKVFEEDRNVEIVVIIDASPTMLSGYEGVSKLQAAIEICCLLYLLAKETGDYVHALIISDDIRYVPQSAGTNGVSRLISLLEDKGLILENGKVNVAYKYEKFLDEQEKLASVMRYFRRKKELVVLSDFYDFFSLDSLKKMLLKKNVHCFQMMSPLDEANKTPYSIFSNDSLESSQGKLRRIDLGGKDKFAKTLGKRLKKIKVHERYLETFVKEML